MTLCLKLDDILTKIFSLITIINYPPTIKLVWMLKTEIHWHSWFLCAISLIDVGKEKKKKKKIGYSRPCSFFIIHFPFALVSLAAFSNIHTEYGPLSFSRILGIIFWLLRWHRRHIRVPGSAWRSIRKMVFKCSRPEKEGLAFSPNP